MYATLKYYFKIWYLLGTTALQVNFANRGTNMLFFIGKLFSLVMSLVFLFVLKNTVAAVGDYTTDQMVIFFLVYLWIDTITQAIFRGVYSFGQFVRNGNFDFELMKPVSPLFKALMGQPDINDVFFLVPTFLVTLYVLQHLDVTFTIAGTLLFIALFLNGIVIATSLHILVLAFTILTTDVDGIMWMYKDFLRLGQFPVSIYREAMRFALFFIVPIGMMITIPGEVLLNHKPTYTIFTAFGMSALFLVISFGVWRWSLRKYTSASS